MAQSFLRLRRALSLSSSSLLTRQSLSAPSPLFAAAIIPRRNPNLPTAPSLSRHFRSSSPLSLSSARSNFRNNNNNFDDEIGPDTILFEGCDYNHWLITMEFPKDPVPTPEEMIETYLQTLAQVVGSYEKAKKNMYACSTTTYQGFQCRVSEEESEKFKGLPGVVFVLPDSYIDPVNKEYGGDKYDNGIITHRPPPVQYGRQGGRYGDRNRDFNRNRPNDQGTRGYENQGPRQGGDNNNRNFGQQQNPQFSYQQVNQGPRNFQNQQPNPGYANQGPNFGENRNFGREQDPQVQRNFGPNAGGERNSPFPGNNAQGNYHPNQGNYNAQGEHRDFAGGNRNFGPPQGVTQGQGSGGNFGQMSGVNNYDGQGAGGNFGHGAGGNNSQGFDYQQNNPGPGGEQRNYRQMGQTGTDQGRY